MRTRWFSILLFVLIAMAGIVCTANPGKTQQDPTLPTISSQELDRASRSFVQLANYASPAVVNINVTKVVPTGYGQGPRSNRDEWFFRFFGPHGMPKEHKQRGQGSGFIISENGIIVTNNHVVQGADKIQVVLKDERTVQAKILGTDPKTDLAVLQVIAEDAKEVGPLPTLKFGNSDAIQVGEWVIAIGNPFGLSHTVTAGIVSAKGRVIGAGPYDNFIQTDASINPGNSGGPLINTNGEVIGINTLINASGQGIGFAIPSSQAQKIIAQLQTSGSVIRGWLGVHIQTVTPEFAEALGLEKAGGALIGQVIQDSPAQDAGFQVKDVIFAFDGTPISKNNDLTTLVANTPVGKTVNVTIHREGKEKTIRVTIGKMPSEDMLAAAQTNDEFGITVDNITPEIARTLNTKPGQGVAVTQVIPGSPAAQAGLQRGDVILEVNHVKVASVKKFYKQLSNKVRNLILVKRGEETSFTTLGFN
jgi:serine protease Do